MTPVTQLKIKKWLFGSRQLKVQVLGAEGAGKTTFLYTFLHNGKPYEEPLMMRGYNREIVEYPRGWEFTIYDVWEGCSSFNLRHGPFHFMSPETLVWLVHDCTEHGQISLLSEYLKAMELKGSKFICVLLSKQDLLPPEERDNIVAEQRQKIEGILREKAEPAGITWYIVAEPGFNLKKGNYIRPFVKDVVQTVLNLDKGRKLEHQKARDDALLSIPSDDELRGRIEEAEISDADNFWKAFMSTDLTSWSHLDHLQAGYLVVLQSTEDGHGMLKCASIFLQHLARLREARPDLFRNTAHFTMTAFWLIQLRVAAFNFQYEANDGAVPVGNDFQAVLLHTPSLMSTRVWTLYYTKEALFAPEARTSFVMPDIQQFPQVTKSLLASSAEGTDDSTDEDIEARESLFLGPDRLPGWAFAVMQNVLGSGLRRGSAVKDALAELQADTVKLRARYPKLAESGDVPPYSETQAYFWVQFVHAALKSLQDTTAKGGEAMPAETDMPVGDFSYERFREIVGIDGSQWQDFYSRRLWESMEARVEFANPDKKALPNVVQVR